MVSLWILLGDLQVFANINFQAVPQVSINSDSTQVSPPVQQYQKSKQPTYNSKDRPGNSIIYPNSSSPLILKDPSTLQLDIEVDTSLNYSIGERFGEIYYRPPTNLNFEQYNRLHGVKMRKNYWKDMSSDLDGESAISGRRLIPPIYISPAFDRIFGGSFVDIRPNGFVLLDFGGRWQRIQNPSIPIRQQRNGGFEFDQQISMNVVGKIGEKLTITADFDNNNSFDFENNLKVEYTGFEEDILQKVEIGNVSLPLSNSLITGAQNLFGVKTQFRFGKLDITAVASTQRGKSDEIEINGGSDGGQGREFEIRASEYEENRHYFLGHFFRDNYETWLRGIPQIISGLNITRVEVYVINRQNNTETLRNFLAFMDLGEGKVIYQENNPKVAPGKGGPSRNDANSLYENISNEPNLRSIENAADILESQYNFNKATDYESITAARKLDEREYTINRQLGNLTLLRKLQSDEVLAIAYEYTYNGKIYKVGELTEDYQNRPEDQAIFLKLLRPTKIDVKVPTWDLMMKNLYSLNATRLSQEGFQLRVVYRDDKTGIDNPSLHEGKRTKDVPLIQLFGLDRLNSNNDIQADGNFDYVSNITVREESGLIVFPVLEPFGSKLKSYFDPNTEANLINKYVYDTLYRTTKADAELDVSKNKFFLSGRMQAGSSSEIILPGINISENSVTVTAGGTPLIEGQDYRVDYNLGRVTIINEAVLNSGRPIKIAFEKADLFNFQSRSLLGTRLDYRLSDDINLGATFLYLNERPLISRVSIGNEPTRNMKYGMDVNIQKESRFLTKMVDAIPGIQTKVPSNINFNAEIAQIRPGTSNFVNGEETSYIDDFEATATPFNLGNNILSWKLAHTPITDDGRFTSGSNLNDDLRLGYKRGKLAWYIIDNIFYRNSGVSKPSNITPEDLRNHYVRGIEPQEIFQNQDRQVVNTNLNTLDIAYYPSERGQYNFNPTLSNDGYLTNPRENWGGITRAITSDVDFDKNNIEYIDFWLMDPFISGENGKVLDGIENTNNVTGGKLIINLGSISEDVIKDSKHGFENGLPADGDTSLTSQSNWGRVTQQQYLTNAFDNSTEARFNQDIGLDGLKSEDEITYYEDFLNLIPPSARDEILQDVSADDFQYYLGDDLDQNDIKIQERYKSFNGTENNSPIVSDINAAYTPSGTNLPDNEDLNKDNTITDLEEYYEYEIDLRKNGLIIGQNFIIDKVTNEVNGDEVSWYQFRIPIRQPTGVQGNISGYKSIRFMRMYATDFQQPVVLRMVKLQLVGSQWRKYSGNLYQRGLYEIPEPYDPKFNVSVINIEENGTQSDGNIPYVLPPGIKRDFDNTSPILRQQNEQSLLLTVNDLKDRDARAVYKNLSTDLINYKRLKMFFHAEERNGIELNDDDVTAFVRFGTDFKDNYYEIELPLKVTQLGTSDPREIWPLENEIDIAFDELFQLKARRNNLGINTDLPFSDTVGIYRITVEGRPEMQTVQTIMIGIRNPESPDSRPKSVTIWANEMRVTDFERTPGWAANAYLNAKMADLMTITASTRYTSFGYGGIQQRIAQRTREETFEYDISANITLDKFLPESSGIKIPMYVSYENRKVTPQFDPLDPDIPLKSALQSIENPEERQTYKKITQDRLERRSINFTNVRKEKTKEGARSRIYDIENLSLTYAYADAKQSNVNIESYNLKSHRGTLAYNFSPQGGLWEPFQDTKSMNGKYLQLIKDFNLSILPSNISFRGDLNRRFLKTQLRNSDLTTTGIRPTYEKFFTFNRMYNVRWSLTKNLSIDYSARANTIIDEPFGDLDTQEKKDEVFTNLKDFGRMKNFDQNINLNYRIPLDKIPITNWINSDFRYSVGYSWNAGAWSDIDSLNLQKILGNTSQNNREIGITGKIDFVKLYNKSKALREINTPPRRRSSRSRTRPTVTQEQDSTKTNKSEMKALKGIARFLMMVRSVNVTYNVREGTMMPGFALDPYLFGMDDTWSAPGWDFILGSQSTDIRDRAAENNWLVMDTIFSTPFTQMRSYDLNLKAMVEPFKNFRIQFDARKSGTGNFNEVFRVDVDPATNDGIYNGLNISRTGSYSITINSMKTSFVKDLSDNTNPNFGTFEDNLTIIKDRLDALNPNEGTYGSQSQDVMIPAFIAAYTGQDANTIELSPFPKIPIPGWRIDYSGLSNIAALKEIFSTISLKHSYSSTYNINNYSNSLLYQDDLELDDMLDRYPIPADTNELGLFISPFLMSQIIIQERYAPLIGISVRTKSRITASIDYKKERKLGMNMSNSQITEMNSNDLAVAFGFTKANIKLPFKVQGSVITLKNDLTFKFNFTLRDTKTVQRKIDEVNTVTAGNVNFQLRPQLGYVLNERLNLNLYFERNINTPRITSSFPRSTTQFGIQVRFSLAQ